MIMKDNKEILVPVANLQIGQAIAQQMEKAFPYILFGYLEDAAKLRKENFEEFKQLYTRKMFECVVKKELSEYEPYPSTRPKQNTYETEPKKPEPAYPKIPEIDIEQVKIPNNSLSEIFAKIIQLCKDFPKDVNTTFHVPAKAKDIASFEKKYQLSLPIELKDLLLFSNGFSLNFDDFYSLEEIEFLYNKYGPMEKEGEEYIFIASVVGDGEEIVFSKKTGLIYWHDHGEFTEYGTLDAVLKERLDCLS